MKERKQLTSGSQGAKKSNQTGQRPPTADSAQTHVCNPSTW